MANKVGIDFEKIGRSVFKIPTATKGKYAAITVTGIGTFEFTDENGAPARLFRSSGVGTHVVEVDKYRTDTYTADGSTDKPYKTIQAAIDAIAAVGVAGQDWTVRIHTGQYQENLLLESTGLHMLALEAVGLVGIVPTTGNAIQSTTNNGNLIKFRMRDIELSRPFVVTGPNGGTAFSDVWLTDCIFTANAAITCACINNLSLSGGYIESAISLSNVNWFYSSSKQMQGTFTMECDSTKNAPSAGASGTSMILSTYGLGAVTLTKGGTATGVLVAIGSRLNSSGNTITNPAGWTCQLYNSFFRGNFVNNGTLQLRGGFIEGTFSGTAPTLNQKAVFIANDSTVTGVNVKEALDALLTLAVHKYGEMYIYDNSTAISIEVANQYHAIQTLGAGQVDGFTFKAGRSGAVSDIANIDGTHVRVHSAAHGLDTNDFITIVNTTNYNGAYKITKYDNDYFDITVAWVDSQSGTWQRGASLKASVGTAGKYKISFNCSADSAGNTKQYKVEVNTNVTANDNVAAQRTFNSGTDWSSMSSAGIITLADGDVVWLSIKGLTDDSDITFRHANVSLTRA